MAALRDRIESVASTDVMAIPEERQAQNWQICFDIDLPRNAPTGRGGSGEPESMTGPIRQTDLAGRAYSAAAPPVARKPPSMAPIKGHPAA
jgi:hypothetical protein